MLCCHCHFGRVTRPRGLCWSCFNTSGVREQYPATSKYGRRGLGNFNARTPLPAVPTDAPPGSPEKLEILIERAQNRQTLWHPEDAGLTGPRRRRRKLAKVG